jgi:hypothetical protein
MRGVAIEFNGRPAKEDGYRAVEVNLAREAISLRLGS